MSDFKVGQKVKCVWSDDKSFDVGREYRVTNNCGDYVFLRVDGYEFMPVLKSGSAIAKFEPITPKFAAVSGDQSLFDLVGAADDEYHIIKRGRCVLSVCYITPADLVIAERKPYVEKYVPKVGDVFRVEEYTGGLYTCLFIDKDGVIHCSRNGHLASLSPFDMITFVKVDK